MKSKRLRLRRMEFQDAPFILELLNEPAFLEHIGDRGVRTLEDAEKYIFDGPMASYAHNRFGLDVIELKSTRERVGIAGLLKRTYLDEPDIGYAVLSNYWRKGIALEACKMVLQSATIRLGLHRVDAIVSSQNYASIGLLIKLGFVYQSDIQIPRSTENVNLYSIQLGGLNS